MALCFPDLYEIGMSNNAIRILYNEIAKDCTEVRCERVFAPAPDFEALLRQREIPLYTLESGFPLSSCDILGFSIGYELLATNMLTVLELGRIPLRAAKRGEDDPIVIAGGPVSTNPHPFGAFVDAVYIGEAEAEFFDILTDLATIKRSGGGRADMLARLVELKAIWTPDNSTAGGKPAWRAVFSGFSASAASTAFPIPVLQTVQSHGTVEIMRGCPNGCRFCHAGYYYRPQRVKPPENIELEVKNLVEQAGYREITLSSLSSGDYPDIVGLFRKLNAAWKDHFISFQLPSLKVDSFTLPLLAELSEVRKSGLTFAVETPIESWQGSINKTVSFDKIAAILKEAKQFGFKSAKFYFMIGLPVPGRGRGEAEAIVEFLKKIAAVERIALNVNIGTFVPKPHTPYQREPQISEADALEAVRLIKNELRPYKFIAISYHSPFTSTLEGVLSRGDGRVGELILSAYKRGARLDAWDEYFDRGIWETVFEEARQQYGFDPREEYLSGRPDGSSLPWDDVHLFVAKSFFDEENRRSRTSELTSACVEECDHPCGSCNDRFKIVAGGAEAESAPEPVEDRAIALEKSPENRLGITDKGFRVLEALPAEEARRFIISFSKQKEGVFYPLHAISGIFERAFAILGLPVQFTEGFNPLPRMELTQPLALGLQSGEDVLAVWLQAGIDLYDEQAFIEAFNRCVPRGIRVESFRIGRRRADGKHTIGSHYWGSSYRVSFTSRSDLDLALSALGSVNPNESLRSDETAMVIEITLNDARGGDRNIVKLLAAALGDEKPLSRCTIIRTACLAADDGGKTVSLKTVL
jgi:radical SAM superfamily enzyme YgiQ (UPF0313 family)